MSMKQRIAGMVVAVVAFAVAGGVAATSAGTTGHPTAPGAPGTAVSVAVGAVHPGPESTLETIAQR